MFASSYFPLHLNSAVLLAMPRVFFLHHTMLEECNIKRKIGLALYIFLSLKAYL